MVQPKLLRFIGFFIGQIGISKWFGKLGKVVLVYSLNEIVDIKVKSFNGEDGTVHQITLILESGKSIPLIGSYSSGFQEKQEIVKTIKSFLAA
ncbi:MAG: hypothetical protein V7K41_19750 [Nostoc sp.]|uniref:hypothetical protein n=1 Tax=Nostoc sp. TaxID=1180 RepID=UPI002FFC4F7A